MNIYFVGMCVSMVIFIAIGVVVSRKVKNAEDFYVAGRQAPVALIAGSIIASYIGVGLFLGDMATCYDGVVGPLLVPAVMQTAGYILGAVCFGRYLRRSKALTIPQFFGERFCSGKMRTLAAITAVVMMAVYLLSVMQGIGTLMSMVTGVSYNLCIILALIVFTGISVMSGSRGVLITDTLMALVFTFALVIAAAFISHSVGGWYGGIRTLAANPETRELVSWAGKPGVLYGSGGENFAWAFSYGIVWLGVCMVGPWQSSRYQMAKNEQVITRAGIWACVGVFFIEMIACLTGALLNLTEPEITDSSQVMIWAAMNMMPTLLGVVLLVGVLSAGISSATTFLSLIGASVANDIVKLEGKKSINAGRIAMVVAALAVMLLAIQNSPSIFWIMYMGSASVASSWLPVAVASIFSKRLTKTGAFCGMLCGFLGYFALRLYLNISGTSLPVFLDPAIVGMAVNVIAMVIGSACTKVTDEEKERREKLFIVPEEEKDPEEMEKTLKTAKWGRYIGVLVTAGLLIFWVIPYMLGVYVG